MDQGAKILKFLIIYKEYEGKCNEVFMGVKVTLKTALDNI